MKLISKFATTLLLLALMLSVIPAAAAQPAMAATCNWAQFVADVTVPDGTSYAPSTAFKKTWRLKNIGTCTWSDVSLIFSSGEKMGAPASAALPTTVAPGQTVDITLDLTAPSAAGHYFGYFKLKSTSGGEFGIGSSANSTFWVEINVCLLYTSPRMVRLEFFLSDLLRTISSPSLPIQRDVSPHL